MIVFTTRDCVFIWRLICSLWCFLSFSSMDIFAEAKNAPPEILMHIENSLSFDSMYFLSWADINKRSSLENCADSTYNLYLRYESALRTEWPNPAFSGWRFTSGSRITTELAKNQSTGVNYRGALGMSYDFLGEGYFSTLQANKRREQNLQRNRSIQAVKHVMQLNECERMLYQKNMEEVVADNVYLRLRALAKLWGDYEKLYFSGANRTLGALLEIEDFLFSYNLTMPYKESESEGNFAKLQFFSIDTSALIHALTFDSIVSLQVQQPLYELENPPSLWEQSRLKAWASYGSGINLEDTQNGLQPTQNPAVGVDFSLSLDHLRRTKSQKSALQAKYLSESMQARQHSLQIHLLSICQRLEANLQRVQQLELYSERQKTELLRLIQQYRVYPEGRQYLNILQKFYQWQRNELRRDEFYLQQELLFSSMNTYLPLESLFALRKPWNAKIKPDLRSGDRGIYLWSKAFMSYENDFIISFLRLRNIKRLWLSPGDNPNWRKVEHLFSLAKDNGVEIELLVGNNLLHLQDHPEKWHPILQKLEKYSWRLHLDLEPQAHPSWDQKEDRSRLLGLFVNSVREISFLLKGKLVLCLPVHFPEETLRLLEPLAEEFVLMAYETSDWNKVMQRTEEERIIFRDKIRIAIRPQDFTSEWEMEQFMAKILESGIKNLGIHDFSSYLRQSE
jgi:hypothetical protein